MAAATEGYVPFPYQKSTYYTFYKLYGSLRASSRHNHAPVPLVIIHGGPGLVHDYLLSLSSLSSKYGIPVVFYDQIGNGRSSHINDKPSPGPFWSIDLFVAELDNLIRYLGIQDKFDLLGHSWGGVLAAEYEVRKREQILLASGARKLILSNSLASQELWHQSNISLLEGFPEDVKNCLKVRTQEEKEEPSSGFLKALESYYAVHGCTNPSGLQLFMESVRKAVGPMEGRTVTNASILKSWSISSRLFLIRVPTLVINGQNDISQDFVIKPFIDHIPDVRWVKFDQSSHTPFLEEEEKYIEVVGEFLTADLG